MKKCISFEEQKGTRYIQGNVYFSIISSAVFCLQNRILDFFLICFAREIKSFYQSSFRNEVDFTNIINVSLKFQKIETRFCRWKSNDYNNINIFLSLENPCTFLLAKVKIWKCVFNTNSELSQNRTEKKILPFKTTVNWLFTDIWCYLVIGCFVWKIVVFRQTFVRVYYILKKTLKVYFW